MSLSRADQDILSAIRRSKVGLTSEELEEKLGRAHQSVSANLTRLRRAMEVRPDVEKRRGSSGRAQTVWLIGQSLSAPPDTRRARQGKVPVATPLLGQKLPGKDAWLPHVGPNAHLDIAILTVLTDGGKFGRITEEIVERTGRPHQSVSGQVRRLVARGLVVHNGILTRAKSGRLSMRWIINPQLGGEPATMALPRMPARRQALGFG